MFIDTHAHITFSEMVDDAALLVERARAAGVERIVNICTDAASLEAGLALARERPSVATAAAVTPHDVATFGEAYFELVAAVARRGDLVAVGETGLDYFYGKETMELQKEFLRRHLALAKECGLPLVIHCRDAFEDLIELVDDERVVLHCFTGTLKEAGEVIEREWYLSLSGIVTFKNAKELQEVAKRVPLDRLLIETDSPYLAPVPMRGKRCEPAYLVHTARFIAELRGMCLEEVARATTENANRFFRW